MHPFAAPGTLDTVLNSMVDQTSSPAQKKKMKPKLPANEAADQAEDKAAGKPPMKRGSPADVKEDMAEMRKGR